MITEKKLKSIGKTDISVNGKKQDRLTCTIIRDEKEFQELEGEWDQLVAKADGTAYSTFQWLWLWWKYFGKHQNRSLCIITLRKQGKLICIAPFYIGSTSVMGLCMQRRMNLMGCGTSKTESFGFYDDYGRSDFLDIICHPDYQDEAAQSIFELMNDEKFIQNVDVLRCSQVSDKSFIINHLLPLFKKEGKEYKVIQSDVCPYIKLPKSFDEFLKSCSSNTRRRLRQSLRAIGEVEGYSVQTVSSEDELEKYATKMAEIHQNKWNNLGYTGAFWDTRFAPFLKEYAKDALKKDRLVFKVANDSAGICALRMFLVFNGKYYDYMSGFEYDSPSSKFRPGIGLLTLAVKDAIKKGERSVELLRGDESYKYDFTSLEHINSAWKVPLNVQNTAYKKTLSKTVELLGFIFYTFQKEKNLFLVQKHLHGLMKAPLKYVQKRYQLLKERFNK